MHGLEGSMGFRFAALISMAAFCLAPTFVCAGANEDCDQHQDWGLRVSGCTEAILAGTWPKGDLAGAYYRRAEAYRGLEKYEKAIADYDRVLRLDPSDSVAYRSRAVAYEGLGQTERAIEDYDRRLGSEPSDVVALVLRGAAFRKLGQFDRTLIDWEKSVELDGPYMTNWWQKFLRENGHYQGEVDGIYDGETREALMACARDPEC